MTTTLNKRTKKLFKDNPPITVTLQRDLAHVPIGIIVAGKRSDLMQLRGIYLNPYKSDDYGVMPLAMSSIQHVKNLFSNAKIDDAALEWYKKEYLFRKYLVQTTERPFPIDKLYPHQSSGVSFIQASRLIEGNNEGVKVLLADDPRLGKTVQAIKSFEFDEDFPIIVLCLKSLTHYWKEQFSLWGEDINPAVLKGSITERYDQAIDLATSTKRAVIITNWQFVRGLSVKRLTKLKRIFTTFIGDEAHIVKNPSSQLYKAVSRVRTKNILLLTATPTERGVQEYFGYLKILRPTEFGSYWKFVTQFTKLTRTRFGTEIGNVRNKPLLRDLLSPLVLRRSAKETVTVPDKVYKDIILEPEAPFKKAYKEIAEKILIEIGDQELEIPNALSKITRLNQLSSFPSMLGYDGVRTPKVDALIDILVNSPKEEKFVLYVSYRDSLWYLMHELKDRNIQCVRFRGEESTLKRFEASSGNQTIKVMMTTPELGGVGIDLSHARSIIFYDLPWSSIVYRQSIERTTKIGITESRYIITLIASDVDKYMSSLLQQKLDNISNAEVVENLVKVLHTCN